MACGVLQPSSSPVAGTYSLLLQVPGTYFDAMNSQTKLGKAVRAAVEELEHLGDLVRAGSTDARCWLMMREADESGWCYLSNPW